jgi:multidrug efflux system membrane fusion protein
MTTNAPMPDEKPARPDAPTPSPAPESEPPHRLRKWIWIGAAVVIAIVIAILVSRSSSSKKQATAKAAKSAANRAIPVVAAKARVGDIGVYLTGLGTVTALNTVTVRSRVDGQLVRVAFQEGQLVQAGDLLAELDPRPFRFS